jgi:hypothetical protein
MAHCLYGLRLAASRFSQFAACSGAPSHRLPSRLRTTPNCIDHYSRDLRPAKWASMINLRCKQSELAMSALGLGCSLIPGARWLCRRRMLRCQRVEQRLGFFQIARVEAFGEPAVNRSEQFASLLPLPLIAPEPRHAHRCNVIPRTLPVAHAPPQARARSTPPL